MLHNIKKIKTELLSGVETLVKEKQISYIEAAVLYCESNGIDLEQAAAVIGNNAPMTAKIEIEASDLNFLKKTIAGFPL
jgi:hypothetical protein